MHLLSKLAVVAGLAVACVSAEPVRIVVVSTSQDSRPHGGPVVNLPNYVRVGHAGANGKQVASDADMLLVKPPCQGSVRGKAQAVADWFRGTLGVDRINANVALPPKVPDEHLVSILPYPYPSPHRHTESTRHRRPSTFLGRIQHSLLILGPWEGRAVSFVLGCGIGVLLRMFWVLAIVMYRSVSPSHGPDEYQPVDEDSEEAPLVHSVHIPMVDEKGIIVVDQRV